MMENESDRSDLQEAEDRFEEELRPRVYLKSGIDMNDLRDGAVEFEVSEDVSDGQTDDGFDKSNIYKYMDDAAMGADVDESGGEPFEVLAKKMEDITADGGVKKMLLKQGIGGPIPDVASVKIHHNFYLEYADEPFDSTYLRDRPITVMLDKDKEYYNAILGLVIGLRTMKKKEQARFLIRPEYAFGKLGAPPRIPGNSTILCQVEVLNFLEAGSDEYNAMTAKEKKEAPFKIVSAEAKNEKKMGQDFFKQRRFDFALRRYRRAITMLEDARLADDEEEKEQQRLLLMLYCNGALCSLRLCQSRRAIMYCNLARRIDGNNPKDYYYRAKALRQLGEFDDAKKNLLKARTLKPSNKDIAKELTELEKKMSQMKLKDQQFYRRMFGTKENPPPAEALQATKDSKAVQTIDDTFRQMIADNLDAFLADDQVMEMPFAGTTYTPAELGTVAAVAVEKNLSVVERGEGANFTVRVQKKQPPKFMD